MDKNEYKELIENVLRILQSDFERGIRYVDYFTQKLEIAETMDDLKDLSDEILEKMENFKLIQSK